MDQKSTSARIHTDTHTDTHTPHILVLCSGVGWGGREAKRKTKKQECYVIFVCAHTQLHLSMYTSLCMLGSLPDSL